ncbi:MAG: sel1 repeat family protein [Erysipelotrichia bacterium]|nr:sel1 repeat family protein [Erysipelotrichia bacterium]
MIRMNNMPKKVSIWVLLAAMAAMVMGCCQKKPGVEEAGKAYQSGDFKKAASIFAPEAEKGNPEAQVNLAFMYYCGMHVEKSYEKAAEWYKKAADQNNVTAQFSLGTLYENGEGVKKDLEEAYFWYSLAENQGDKDSRRLRQELEQQLSKNQVSSQKKRISGWKPAR